MRKLLWLVLLMTSLTSFAQYRPDFYSCNGSVLVDGFERIIHQFTFRSDCQTALQQTRQFYGRFCDNEEMRHIRGVAIHRFTFRSDCVKALNEGDNFYGIFCDRQDMISDEGVIQRFTFGSECQQAVREVIQYRGYFCNGSRLYNYFGEQVASYRFSSDCQNALRRINEF